MLDSLLAQEEGKILEFKESANALSRVIQTIVAFANTAGGTLIIGVRDKTKEIIGVDNVVKLEERISSAVADSVSPLLTPNYQFVTWRNRDLLIITVAYNPAPYFIKSQGLGKGVYIRLGSTNRIADKATIAEIRRLVQHESFDELANIKASKNDIDFELCKTLFATRSKKFNIQKAKTLDLLVEHQSTYYPSNGGLLLFSQYPYKFFPNALIRCGRFSGVTKTKILDQSEIDKPLTLAIDDMLAFIDKHTLTRSEIGRKVRVDIPQYPPEVIREAVMNALVHTDYSIKGANIQIAIFDDRIEITNPGALPYGLSLEKALTGISQLRNRVIGQVFRELGFIERWGSGLTRMIDICEEQGILKPIFEEQDHFFRVTIFHESTRTEAKEKWKSIIINYLYEQETINVAKASELWRVTSRTASSRLGKMRKEGLIAQIGTGPYDPKKKYVLTRKK